MSGDVGRTDGVAEEIESCRPSRVHKKRRILVCATQGCGTELALVDPQWAPAGALSIDRRGRYTDEIAESLGLIAQPMIHEYHGVAA